MKKKLTKRILALVLALALCTALMLPGFAAVTNDPNDCVHTWGVESTIYRYNRIDVHCHQRVTHHFQHCIFCTSSREWDSDSVVEAHTPPCSKCGWG